MPRQKKRPAYTLHKPTGQARVRIDGRDHYLGEHGSQESRDRYDDLIAEWAARQDVSRVTLTIDDLALLYLQWARGYYKMREVNAARRALRLLVEFAGTTRARQFGPRMFRRFRDSLVGRKAAGHAGNKGRILTRQYLNKMQRCIVRVFKWAASEEYVPVDVWQALRTVPGLKKGRTIAPEAAKVKPVDDERVEAVLTVLPPPVAAMVELQRATGMRPGEVVQMRPCDITRRTDGLWCYRPQRFKTDYRDDAERVVFLGPRAQQVLAPYLDRDPDAPCFSPTEAVEWRQEQKRQRRKTPVQPSQRDRSKPSPIRPAGDAYSEDSYRRAIHYACKKAKVKQWSPNQIRHAVASVVREKFGLEASQVVLGHARADVTQIYAERNLKEAANIARQIG